METTTSPAQKLTQAAIDLLRDERGVHAETAIAGTARMAGTFLFESFGFTITDAKPGQLVLSDVANEQGPRLMNILGSVLDQQGVVVDPLRIADDTPPKHMPRLEFLQTYRLLSPRFHEIATESGLSLTEAADFAAVATGILIVECRDILDPTMAVGIALFGFVEGTKTYPGDL